MGSSHFCSRKQAFEQQYSLEAGKGACPADVALSARLFEAEEMVEAANYIILIVHHDFVGRSLFCACQYRKPSSPNRMKNGSGK